MNIAEALSDRNINNMIELIKLAEEKFGKDVYSSRVVKNYKSGYNGEVELRNGDICDVKVRLAKGEKSVVWL